MKKRRLSPKIIVLAVEFVAIAILVIYLGTRNKYENVFCKNTIINGEDCSLLTVEEANKVIQENMRNYTLKLIFKDFEIEYISGSEIGLKIDDLDSKLNDIKNQQRKDLFLRGGTYWFNDLSYNKEQLSSVLLDKKQLQKDYMEEKTELKYDFNFDKNLFELVEKNVYYIDFEQVFKFVCISIESMSQCLSFDNLYELPENNNYITTIEELNKLVNVKITYQFSNGEEYTIGARTLYTWLVQDEEGNYRKDDGVWNQKIVDFVTNDLSAMANTIDVDREFKPTDKDTTIIVNAGNYGYQVDIEKEVEQLKYDLENLEKIKREPCYAKVENSTENNGLGNSYVEIDLTRQKVWVYVDGKMELETDCVTGCVNKGYDTPTGIFTLTYKQQDRILRGKMLPNGKREYESHVNYWMPFNGGIGLHDATWRKSFGGEIYINNGSHGCINLPFKAAKKLYEIINSDMPIIVYES